MRRKKTVYKRKANFTFAFSLFFKEKLSSGSFVGRNQNARLWFLNGFYFGDLIFFLIFLL